MTSTHENFDRGCHCHSNQVATLVSAKRKGKCKEENSVERLSNRKGLPKDRDKTNRLSFTLLGGLSDMLGLAAGMLISYSRGVFHSCCQATQHKTGPQLYHNQSRSVTEGFSSYMATRIAKENGEKLPFRSVQGPASAC